MKKLAVLVAFLCCGAAAWGPSRIYDFVLRPSHQEAGVRLTRRYVLLRENAMRVRDAADGISLCDAPLMAARKPFEDFAQPIGILRVAIEAEKKREVLTGVLPPRQFQVAGLGQLRVVTRWHPNPRGLHHGRRLLAVENANIRGFMCLRNLISMNRGEHANGVQQSGPNRSTHFLAEVQLQ